MQLFLRKRKTEKEVGLSCTGKGNIRGRKLKENLEEKILIRNRNCPFMGNCFFFIFFNEKEFCFFILGEVGAEFTETS